MAAPDDNLSLQNDADHAHFPWLGRFAWIIVGVTFCLLILGGSVTSKDAGLAVPDWPRTFGQNMFLYPPSKWTGGIFWEHTHRLVASLVGMLTLAFAGWVMMTPLVHVRLRILAGLSLLLVIIQGIMGGLRVTEVSTVLGVIHGVMGQLYFCLTIVIAIMTTRTWINRPAAVVPRSEPAREKPQGVSVKTLAYVFFAALVIQLALGATMRHYRAGLAIPDFPTAYGQVVPPLSSEGIRVAMDSHAGGDQHLVGYYSPWKVSVHFAHRLWAVTVVIAAFALISTLGARGYLDDPRLRWPAVLLTGLIVLQLTLGAMVIWTGRHAEVATAHQTTGAIILGLTTVMAMMLQVIPTPALATAPSIAAAGSMGKLEPQS